MLTLELDDLMIELQEGTVKHVGASNAASTAKLYDVEGVDVRAFGDERVKLAFDDGEGNEVEIALFADAIATLAADLETVRAENGQD